MSTLEAVLARHHVKVTPAEFLADLDQVLSAFGSWKPAQEQGEDQFLSEHGGITVTGRPDELYARAAARRAVAEAALEPLSTSEAARLLGGRDESRVRHRLRVGGLYAVPSGRRGHRFPAWQFHAGQPLPGLQSVLAALPDGLHPLEVVGFMSTPQPELVVEDKQVAPREWLIGGGDAARVVVLAAHLGERP